MYVIYKFALKWKELNKKWINPGTQDLNTKRLKSNLNKAG